jgi:hypothetical protein
MTTSTNITTLRRWRTAGVALQVLGVIVGWIGYQIGISRGIAALNESPEALTSSINVALYSTLGGCILALTGFIMFVAAAIQTYRQNRTSPVQA